MSLGRIWHAALLIALVLGSIYTGVATPTEASAVGAAGAFAIAGLVYRVLNPAKVMEILRDCLRVSASILLIIGCAKIFGDYLNLVRLPQHLTQFLLDLNLPNIVVLLVIMALLIVLGMFVDAVSLILLAAREPENPRLDINADGAYSMTDVIELLLILVKSI